MWEVPTHLLLNAGYKGLLPLVPLTTEGKRHEAVEQAITQLMPRGKKPEVELLASLGALGSLVYTEDVDESWLQGRFRMMGNIFKDSCLKTREQDGVLLFSKMKDDSFP